VADFSCGFVPITVARPAPSLKSFDFRPLISNWQEMTAINAAIKGEMYFDYDKIMNNHISKPIDTDNVLAMIGWSFLEN
jgi:hypothetical protein